jgi:hypothetical protein
MPTILIPMLSIKTSINQVNNMVWQFVAIEMKLLHENFRKGVVFCFYCPMQWSISIKAWNQNLWSAK